MFVQHLENGYKTLNLVKRSCMQCSELSAGYINFGQFSSCVKYQSQKKSDFLI